MVTSHGFRDLKVYRLAFELAMQIFEESKHFPQRKFIPSLIRFAAPLGVSQLTSARVTEKSVTPKCS